MTELIFLVEEAHEGGLTARSVGASIFTEADDFRALEEQIRDAVMCHFDEADRPRFVRIHFTREEVIAL
jgi:hypothetical protein